MLRSKNLNFDDKKHQEVFNADQQRLKKKKKTYYENNIYMEKSI